MSREVRRQWKRARAVSAHAERLIQQGQLAAALEPLYDVVEISRALAADDADPSRDQYLRELGGVLNWRGVVLAALDRREDALTAFDEAVATLRPLGDGTALRRLAVAQNHRCAVLNALGRRDEALGAAEEAVTIMRSLANSGLDGAQADLADTLALLSSHLGELNRQEDALGVLDEVIAIRRDLASVDSRARPDLADVLATRSRALSAVGRHEDALAAIEAAAAILGELEDEHIDPYFPLATAWCIMADALNAVGRDEDALHATDAALRRALLVIEWADDFWPPEAVALVEDCVRRAGKAGREIDDATMRRVRAVRKGSGPPAMRPGLTIRRIGDR